MSDTTNMLKAELGIQSDQHGHHQHHHDKILVPTNETTEDVTHELQSQLGQSTEADREICEEKLETEKK